MFMSTEYDIKVDGEPATFEGGAIRFKKDKGRFDLIPWDVNERLMNLPVDLNKFENVDNQRLFTTLSRIDGERFLLLIILITVRHYQKKFDEAYPEMLLDLAIHFQKGAEKYGEHNCEKGIPLWSFIDSGTRHLMQYLCGRTDEPHYISAIWNFWMADWTLHHNYDEEEKN